MRLLSLTLILSAFTAQNSWADWSSSISLESRNFFESPVSDQQEQNYLSTSLRTELDAEFENGNPYSIELFARVDQYDDDRDHFDIAELYTIIPSDNWELLLGINKVFWGVTESANLVDVINQTDGLEGFDGEDKLGQPMILLNTFHDWGNLDFYLLPGFREREFVGEASRLRLPLNINTAQASYESSDEDAHIDFAVRWSNFIDIWDIGISVFNGTSRDPDLLPVDTTDPNNIIFAPFYPQMTQLGIDIQATTESWLWKLETIDRRADQSDDFQQAALGFEYTFVGINESDIDLGWVVEYLYDDRDEAQSSNPFENDALIGARFAFNDVQSTEILSGVITDLDDSSLSFSIEASRRLGQRFKLDIESRLFENIADDDISSYLQEDSYLQADLTYYF